MAVTIKQIADLAGVSRGTVDKVLNKRPGVKEETRTKVLRIAKELNYTPNFLGKALVQSHNPVRIGVILTPDHNPYIQKVLEGVKAAEKEFSAFGIEVIIRMPITLEAAEQISILTELEQAGVNGIALFPINDDLVKEKINQLIDGGIKVLSCNSKTDGINDFCFIGQDHYKGGRTAAGLLLKLLPEGGKVAVITSSAHLSCHPDRISGFTSRIHESHIPIDIVGIEENQDRKDEAFRITLEYLNNHPDLKGLYVTGGGIGGVGNALKLVDSAASCKVVGHDLTEDSVELLNDYTVDFIIGQNPTGQGYQAIKILFEALVKKIKPDKFVEIPIEIITNDSM